MKIDIITVYQPFGNLGSYLQTYSLVNVLKDMGHEVRVVKIDSNLKSALRIIFRINPKREFFLRFKKVYYALKDLYKLPFLSSKNNDDVECAIYGSDEIWNVSTSFFKDKIYWGYSYENVPKVAYAISAGHATSDDFKKHKDVTSNILSFHSVMTRDIHTHDIIKSIFNIETKNVIDPTLLIDLNRLSVPIKIPKNRYLCVYTYGLNKTMIDNIKRFANAHNLIIVSPCFWHHWADKTVECSALQLSTLMASAEYVFTSTFHGTIFALLNHTNCAILPVRKKVREISSLLNCQDRLIDDNCSYESFNETISKPFNADDFDNLLKNLRQESLKILKNTLISI